MESGPVQVADVSEVAFVTLAVSGLLFVNPSSQVVLPFCDQLPRGNGLTGKV